MLFGAMVSAWATAVMGAPVALQPYEGPAPDFTLDRLAAEQAPPEKIQLADLRGRIVLVHFFATWCEPCREELPALARFAERFAGRPVVIIAVDVEEVDARVRRFLAETPVPFAVLMDRDRAVTKAWQVSALPSTVVLDADLRPRFMAEGDVDWDRREADVPLSALADEARLKTTNTTEQTGGKLQ
ncbi:TlpA disulfide reductase family protein [Aquabacter sp. CN5-332]|uniref:TlpA family protein disulfide reductase n=1 Tax=Aquabacter sp. CN5-332 TaxID=3156608 RepID=UPI0032B49AB5